MSKKRNPRYATPIVSRPNFQFPNGTIPVGFFGEKPVVGYPQGYEPKDPGSKKNPVFPFAFDDSVKDPNAVNYLSNNKLSSKAFADYRSLLLKSILGGQIDGVNFSPTDNIDDALRNILQNPLNTNDQLNDALKNYLERLSLHEQRAYDSPVAQLQRLMMTGMSRLQAIELLSSAGSNANTIGSLQSTPPSTTELADKQQSLSDTQSTLNIVSSAVSILGLLLSGVTAGASTAVAGFTATGLQLGNAIAQKKFQADVSANKYRSLVLDGINSGFYGAQGTESFQKIFSSPMSLMQYNSQNAASYPALQQYLSGQYQQDISNPYFTDAVNSLFEKQWFTTKPKQSFDLNSYDMKRLKSLTLLQDSQMSQISQQIAESAQRCSLYNEQIKNVQANTNKINAEIKLLGAQEQLVNSQTTAQNQLNTFNQPMFDAYQNNMHALTQTEAQRLAVEVATWQNIDPDKLAEYHAYQMANDAQYNSIMTNVACNLSLDAQNLINDESMTMESFLDIHGDLTGRNLLAFNLLGMTQATAEYWNAKSAKRAFHWSPVQSISGAATGTGAAAGGGAALLKIITK